MIIMIAIRSRDSSVGIAMGYSQLNGWGLIPERGKIFFSSL
jgi:hypothetical protein